MEFILICLVLLTIVLAQFGVSFLNNFQKFIISMGSGIILVILLLKTSEPISFSWVLIIGVAVLSGIWRNFKRYQLDSLSPES